MRGVTLLWGFIARVGCPWLVAMMREIKWRMRRTLPRNRSYAGLNTEGGIKGPSLENIEKRLRTRARAYEYKKWGTRKSQRGMGDRKKDRGIYLWC